MTAGNYSIIHIGDMQTLSRSYPGTLSDTFQYLESLKTTYNIRAIFITGDDVDHYNNDKEWINYSNARALTTIPLYENPGNHDVGSSVYDFTYWDKYIGAGNRSDENGTFILNKTVCDFIYIQPPFKNYYDNFTTNQIAMMNAIVAANPDKIPLFGIHCWFMNIRRTRFPQGDDILNNVSMSRALILTGHVMGVHDETNFKIIQGMSNPQSAKRSWAEMYIVHNDGTKVDRIWKRHILIYPVKSISEEMLVYTSDIDTSNTSTVESNPDADIVDT